MMLIPRYFKLFDFGFYLHQETTSGTYPEAMQQKIAEVQALSPYYLLFGKQTDSSGVYTRFWVDVKVPSAGDFECTDSLKRELFKRKFEFFANNALQSGFPNSYVNSEIRVIVKLSPKIAQSDDSNSQIVNTKKGHQK